MSQNSDSEKTHEPTEKKLRDARAKGQIPRSPDLLTVATYGGFILVGLVIGGDALVKSANGLLVFLDRPAQMLWSRDGLETTAWAWPILFSSYRMAVFFAVPALCVLALLFAQKSLIFTPSKLGLKLSRISMMENAKNKYGPRGLFEFSKSAVKLIIYAAVLWIFVISNQTKIIESLFQGASQFAVNLVALILQFLAWVWVVALVIGAVDFLWQRHEFMQRNRMSLKEIRDEAKEAEGDPHQKAQRRARGEEITRQNLQAKVPKADVIIVNPTHYAVALQWDSNQHSAPICVAKGVDLVAARIREIADEHDVPIHSDPPVARAIHATVDIGAEIQPDLYRAVAAALRFAEAARKAKKGKL